MISIKIFFFTSETPIHFIKSTKLSKLCNSKKFLILRIFSKMFFFFSEIYLKVIFCTAQFFILTKNLHTAHTSTEMKQNSDMKQNINETNVIFINFVKLLNISLVQCSLLLSHLKSVFLMIESEQKRLN